jgi:hypothetical protein
MGKRKKKTLKALTISERMSVSRKVQNHERSKSTGAGKKSSPFPRG